MEFFSKTGQDRFVFETFFRGRRDGIYLDIGTAAGAEPQNTLFFERLLDWSGLRVTLPMDATRITSLLEQQELLRVDFCAIDLRRASSALLTAFDFNRFDVKVIAITSEPVDERLPVLMAELGYELVVQLAGDFIFHQRGLRRLPRTTIICAVWHGDAQRHELMHEHARNLASQTVPVEMVYVFDGKDEVPESLPGRKLVAHENLSIYQAWNVALSIVDTPFVMNLNLDDRLAPDAVEHLETALIQNGAALAGGDWKACYSQPQTDAVEPCYPADRLPFVADWPPPTGTLTRLGSGTGDRGTFGPATLWRLDAHIGAPRFPWQFPDGTPIRVIGDLAWWTVLQNHQKARMTRLPLIIGHYHSRPGSQAEFRGPQNEQTLMARLGLSLL
jgi:hypothetical protein